MNFHSGLISKILHKTIALIFIAELAIGCSSKTKHFGAQSTLLTAPVSVSEVLQPQYYKRTTLLSGNINAACRNEGCWIGVTDGIKKVGVIFANSTFTAPIDCKGKNVVLEGRMTDHLFSAEDAKKFDLEAGANHDFCLLGEDNCGQKHPKSASTSHKENDCLVQVFEATSMIISEK